MSLLKTWIVSDDHYADHLTGGGHPESPARYHKLDEALQRVGLKTIDNTLKPRAAKFSELKLCHNPEYIQSVHQQVDDLQFKDGSCCLSGTMDTHISPSSYDVALLAVGGVLVGIDTLMQGLAQNIFCNIRPPGHHAERDKGMGFCLFNNVAIGARYAQTMYPKEIRKVLIVDWDVHHGNGTQNIFEDDETVFYFSTHQKDHYPHTGSADEKGKGNILNVPIAGGRGSREAVLDAFRTDLPEAMLEFQPDLVMISCGFDGHAADRLGHFNLTDDDFVELTHIVKEISHTYAEDRLISVLEGGYSLESLASAAVAHVKTLAE